MAMVDVDSGSLQADSQPKSSGLVLGRRPLSAVLHSSNEPGELWQWSCHDDSTINIDICIIIIIIIIIVITTSVAHLWAPRRKLKFYGGEFFTGEHMGHPWWRPRRQHKFHGGSFSQKKKQM